MEDKIWNCILKRLSETETELTKACLDEWLKESPDHVQKYKEAKFLWQLSAKIKPEQHEGSFEAIKANILVASSVEVKPVKLSFWKYGIAASLIGAFLFSLFYFLNTNKPANQKEEWVIKKAGVGKVIQIVLPDSSKVWLNSGTELAFTTNFNSKKTRSVKLTGEAYFEVKHDPSHPFVVKSGDLVTTVYGTSFSVRAYRNESSATVSVNSGKVGVTAPGNESAVFLLPEDKLRYDLNQKSFLKTTITDPDVDSWINGDLIFDQTPLEEVLKTLSRKYDVRFETGSANYKGCMLTARFQNKPIQEVLKTLQLVMNIQSEQIDHTIILKGGTACN
ncbi:FecR family protein [Pedobacter metabolipauper]|uniref:FecR family protein n=1 Tax=Pedobacter metabolipauper TaxID=425513 RepID=A0A4R6SS54_9SPHI|nr:FecR domain-containing protein [Pedobacter metabolipauper]TDQ08205.1 FecR family protein [Pedobacter metabolipauper]